MFRSPDREGEGEGAAVQGLGLHQLHLQALRGAHAARRAQRQGRGQALRAETVELGGTPPPLIQAWHVITSERSYIMLQFDNA